MWRNEADALGLGDQVDRGGGGVNVESFVPEGIRAEAARSRRWWAPPAKPPKPRAPPSVPLSAQHKLQVDLIAARVMAKVPPSLPAAVAAIEGVRIFPDAPPASTP
eukprot:Hpha_TRINITY_DN23649_c0_g1::TRINITY_DN23649_c0_g1_i1::g.57651::m.57651